MMEGHSLQIRDSVIFVSVSALFTYIEYFHHPSCIQSFMHSCHLCAGTGGIAQHKIIMVFVLMELRVYWGTLKNKVN